MDTLQHMRDYTMPHDTEHREVAADLDSND